MKRKTVKTIAKYFSLALSLAMVVFLCVESLMPASRSSLHSQTVGGTVDDLFSALSPNAKPLSSRVNNWHWLIRKLFGHFGAFLLLGALTGITAILFDRESKRRRILTFALLTAFGVLFAGITEILQLDIFTSGRSCSFKDVLIDSCGYLPTFLLTYGTYLLVTAVKRRRKSKKTGGVS